MFINALEYSQIRKMISILNVFTQNVNFPSSLLCLFPGTGTFGRVCLCRDKNTDNFYALKILTMSDVIRLKQVEHVKNEKSILHEVNHPFIVNM